MRQLYIGNKNYSSWSMRPWVLMKQAGIAFEEVMVRFDSFAPGSAFRRVIDPLNPAGTVPVLVDDGIAVADTLAICEYLAETHPDLTLWPADRAQRAQARAVCAEMHAGFRSLRAHCGMNIEADLAQQGRIAMRDQPGVGGALGAHGGGWGGRGRSAGGRRRRARPSLQALAEMPGVSAGLGYFILDTRDRLAYSEPMAATVLIGAPAGTTLAVLRTG